MKKFLALYFAPISVIDEWQKTDPATRKTEEDKMRAAWQAWMQQNGKSVIETAGTGKTKRVTQPGNVDHRNDVMLYSIVEAQSHADAAKLFEHHPHLGIPHASIEVMEINPLSGMG